MTIEGRQKIATDFAIADQTALELYEEHMLHKKRYEQAARERDRVLELLIQNACVGANTTTRLFRIDSETNVLVSYDWKVESNRVSARVIKTEPSS